MNKFNEIKFIHQVMILDGGRLPDQLPALIDENCACVRKIYPEAEYKLWSGIELRDFIASNFPQDVSSAFKTLTPYSYQCDLARFCLLYVFGGIYIDLGIRLMNAWNIPQNKQFAAFRDVSFVSSSWSTMQTGLLWAAPYRPEFKKAIDFIVDNCRTRYYGGNALYPTGPILLGRACVAAMVAKGQSPEADDQHIGQCRCVTPDAEMLNVSYVSKEGTLVALRTKRVGGDLTHLGVAGANNYNELWRSRQVYGEVERVWPFDDFSVKVENRAKLTETGIAVASRTEGRICYGPFATLAAGRYRLQIDFSPETSFSRLYVDVCTGYGDKILHVHEHSTKHTENKSSIAFEFELDQRYINVEYRVQTFGDFSGELRRFSLRDTPQVKWNHDSINIQTTIGLKTPNGIRIRSGKKGRAIYGPYVDLHSGDYVLKVKFGPHTIFSRLLLDIGAGSEHKTIKVLRYRSAGKKAHEEVEFCFTLDADQKGVEFRLHVDKDFEGEFQSYALTRPPKAAGLVNA